MSELLNDSIFCSVWRIDFAEWRDEMNYGPFEKRKDRHLAVKFTGSDNAAFFRGANADAVWKAIKENQARQPQPRPMPTGKSKASTPQGGEK